MKVEDIKKIESLNKDKFYLFRIGKGEWPHAIMKGFRQMCEAKHIKGVLIEANDFEVIEIDNETYKLVKEKDESNSHS